MKPGLALFCCMALALFFAGCEKGAQVSEVQPGQQEELAVLGDAAAIPTEPVTADVPAAPRQVCGLEFLSHFSREPYL